MTRIGSPVATANRLWQQDQSSTPLFRYDARKLQPETLADWRSVPLEICDPFEVQLELFLQGVASGTPARGLPTWEDAVTNQRLIQAAYRSIAERREVSPEEISLR
jgi:predicted dehydrogenase